MPIRSTIPAVGLLLLLGTTKGDVIAQNAATPTMKLQVDETQAFRRIAFIHEEIRVQPGPLALAYPRWIPGEHGPTGPIENLAMIRVRSGEVTLPWTRDPDDINTIKIDIPANTSEITVDFDTLLENTISDHQLLLAWNTSVLYPRGIDKRELMIEPSILLPPNWKQGSSMPGARRRVFSSRAPGLKMAGGTRLYRGQPIRHR
jgi:hypothetical protein